MQGVWAKCDRDDVMRIVVVISSLSRGGAERVVSILTREWAKCHHVIIGLFDGAHQAYEHGGRVIDLRLPPLRSPLKRAFRVGARSIELVRLYQRERPDRIVSFMENANTPAIAAAALTGFLDRLCVSVRNNPSMMEAPYRVLIPWLYRVPGRVVAPSEGVKEGLEEMGVPAEKLLTIPNPVVTRSVATAGTPSPFPKSFILGIGRLHAQKGFDRLLRAFSNVDSRDLNLVILGEGQERTALISLAKTLGIRQRAHLPGAVSNIGAWYQHAQCFVLSSNYEGWPNVLVEAMAHGCPVVSFDCRYGPAEICEGGKSGLLVAQDDIKALTTAITRVVSDSALRGRLSMEGRKRAKTFAVEKIAPRWLADHSV